MRVKHFSTIVCAAALQLWPTEHAQYMTMLAAPQAWCSSFIMPASPPSDMHHFNIPRCLILFLRHSSMQSGLHAGGTAAAVASSSGSAAVQDGPGKYELVGFISHLGANLGCGHYVCHVKKEGR